MQSSVDTIWERPTTLQFSSILATIDDVQAMQKFLRDVMTEKEIIEISSRLEAAKMLREGRKYAEIINETKLSSRTVARISDWIQNGQGGYENALTVIAHHDHIPLVRAE